MPQEELRRGFMRGSEEKGHIGKKENGELIEKEKQKCR